MVIDAGMSVLTGAGRILFRLSLLVMGLYSNGADQREWRERALSGNTRMEVEEEWINSLVKENRADSA